MADSGPLALIATGGYGRRELSPRSDVDLLALLPPEDAPAAARARADAVAERFHRALWDADLEAGFAARTLPQTLALAREDHTARTALLDCRLVVGDSKLFKELERAMVTELEEVTRTRDMIERELTHLRRLGHPQPTRVLLGAMIEVPTLLFELDGLVKVADFVSVGTNDLLQFMTASDRGNVLVAQRFDALSRAFLRALKSIADKFLTEATSLGYAPREVVRYLARRIKDLIGVTAEVRVVQAGGIERSLGKARRVVDKRPKP